MELGESMIMLNSLLISIAFFIGAVLFHVILCRLTSTQKFMLKGLVTGLAAVLSMLVIQVVKLRVDLVSIYILGTAWLAYLMFFINLLNSITLKMLKELDDNNGELQNREFDHLFGEEQGVEVRINSMEMNGFISIDDGKISLTSKSLLMVKIITLLRKIFSMS